MPEAVRVATVLGAAARLVYEAWLDSVSHSAFSGGQARVEPRVGGAFTSWYGYVRGECLELEPYRRIVQAWRTVDFPPESPDSRVEILLEEVPDGTRFAVSHTGIPDGLGEELRLAWLDYYFERMKEYFEGRRES